jgi:hypothetical protein
VRRRASAVLLVLATLWPLAADAQQPEVEPLDDAVPEAARTLTVTPRTGLVHDQVVQVRGRGFPGGAWIGVLQCLVGGTSIRDCGPAEFLRVGPNGGFTEPFAAQAVFDTRRRYGVDCRVTDCLLVTTGWPTQAGARSVELEFDPAGPDPVRHAATVTPDTGLVDEQIVTVAADDFQEAAAEFDFLHLSLCVLPVDSLADCDPTTAHNEVPDDDGSIEDTLKAYAVLRTRDGRTHDCRTGGCAVLVKPLDDVLSEAALVPVAYDPGAPLAPAPVITVAPDEDLRDGQILRVHAEGVEPRTIVDVDVCAADATSWRHCDFAAGEFEFSRADGTVDIPLAFSAVIRTSSARGVIDCRVEACTMFLTEDELGFPRVTPFPLDVDPAAPLFRPSLHLRRSTDLRGGDRVRVDARVQPSQGSLLIQCLAGARGRGGCANGTAVEFYVASDGYVYEGAGTTPRPGIDWHGRFAVRRHLHLGDGRQVDCRRAPCEVVLVGRDFGTADRVRIHFAG